MIELKYSRKYILTNSLLGLVILAFGMIRKIFWENSSVLDYYDIIIGLILLGIALFCFFSPYLVLEKERITKNSLKTDRIDLSDITKIKRHGSGLYILHTQYSKMRINTMLIDSESLVELDRVLDRKLKPQD